MNSYHGMEMAAEARAQQLLAEAEHRRLVHGIESHHDRRSPVASIGAGVAATFHRLTARVAGTAAGTTAVQGR